MTVNFTSFDTLRVNNEMKYFYFLVFFFENMNCDRLVVESGSSVSSTNNTDRHDITEILLKVALSTIKLTSQLKRIIFTVVYKSIIMFRRLVLFKAVFV